MYEITKNPALPEDTILASALEVGDLASVVDFGHPRIILLRAYDKIISLSDPQNTWNLDCTLHVKRLPLGSILQLQVKD